MGPRPIELCALSIAWVLLLLLLLLVCWLLALFAVLLLLLALLLSLLFLGGPRSTYGNLISTQVVCVLLGLSLAVLSSGTTYPLIL